MVLEIDDIPRTIPHTLIHGQEHLVVGDSAIYPFQGDFLSVAISRKPGHYVFSTFRLIVTLVIVAALSTLKANISPAATAVVQPVRVESCDF